LNQFTYCIMAKSNISAIKNWIETMGFELVDTHDFIDQAVKINYYTLGTFGVYEEISIKDGKPDDLRFITWNPWGIDFEVHSITELHDAYQDFIRFSPELHRED